MARVAWGQCKRLVSESTCKAGRWKLWVLADDGYWHGQAAHLHENTVWLAGSAKANTKPANWGERIRWAGLASLML